jgi:hypothetical protein
MEGTLNLGVYYSLWGHVLRAASWPQRWAVDLQVGGSQPLSGEADTIQTSVITDPGTVALFYSSAQAQGQPQIGQWQTSADPEALIGAISQYERRLVTYAGINAADQIRMAGDPRSGYAVSVSRDAQREVQRRFEPQFRAGDLAALRLAAILLNRAYGEARYPEGGYRISYEGIPYSGEERRSQLDRIRELRDQGLMSRVQAYQELYPGVSEEDARAALAEIDGTTEAASPVTDTEAPVAEVEAPAADAAAADEPLAATALNGAQVTSALEIVQQVAAGQLPRESAVVMLVEFFQLSADSADRVLGSVGRGFVPSSLPESPPDETPPPPPPDDNDDQEEPDAE